MVAEQILEALQTVRRLRDGRLRDPELGRRVQTLKDYQARRLGRSYADLLADDRQGPATRFFLQDLYGPQDFSERDHQFARIVPIMVRMLPDDLLSLIASIAQLHAESEGLDERLALALPEVPPTATGYRQAWQTLASAPERLRQLAQVMACGHALGRFTRQRLLRNTLHWMRGPARAAGFGALQQFLERGFDAFAHLGDPRPFLHTIEARELLLLNALETPGPTEGLPVDQQHALAWLP